MSSLSASVFDPKHSCFQGELPHSQEATRHHLKKAFLFIHFSTMYGIIYTLPVSRKRGTPLQPPFSPTHPHPSSDRNDAMRYKAHNQCFPFLISGVDHYYPHTSITQPPVFWHHRLPLGARPRGRLLTPADEDDDEVFVTVGFRVSDTHFFWTPFHRMPLGARPRGRVASRGFCD